MNCNETTRLLEPDADGELDLVRHLDLEEHLRTCSDCAHAAENVRARRAALRASLPRFTAPPGLRENISARLRAELKASSVAHATPPRSNAGETPPPPSARAETSPTGAQRPHRVLLPFWSLTRLAASVAIAVFAGYIWGAHRGDRQQVLREAITDHIRSLQVNHLTDVASTDQHTVKPWFAGKTSFSPPVVDLAASGFPLLGGRLENVDGQTAVALVFQRRKHTINLFIWPNRDRAVAESEYQHNGFQVESWTEKDLAFVAVSEIPAAELAQFAAEFRNATR